MQSALQWTAYPASQLQQFSSVWQSINVADLNMPVLDPRYLQPLLQHMGTGRELLVIGAMQGQPRAAILVEQGRRGIWHSFEAGGCPFGAWVCDRELDREQALASLLRALPGFGMLIALTRQDPALTRRPNEQGRVRTVDYIETMSIRIDSDFDMFWKGRSKGFRQNIRTALNRQNRDGISATFAEIADPETLSAAVDAHGLLESASWKAGTGNALHPENTQGIFMRQAMCSLAESGNARAFQYRYDGRLVASALCVDNGDAMIVLRTSFDEGEKFTSPGQLMHYAMLQALFEHRRFRIIEFYGAAMNWERQWTNESRVMYHLNLYRSPWLAMAHELLAKRKKGDSDCPS